MADQMATYHWYINGDKLKICSQDGSFITSYRMQDLAELACKDYGLAPCNVEEQP